MTNEVYRTPGRTPDAAAIPKPRWGTLFRPPAWATFAVVVIVIPVMTLNVIATSGGTTRARLTPWVEATEDWIAGLLLLTFVLLGILIWRVVKPSWIGFVVAQKALYLACAFFTHMIVLLVCETMMWMTHGTGFLSETRLVASGTSPTTGRVAYVYESCFLDCSTETYIAESSRAITMHPIDTPVKSRTSETVQKTTLEWNAEGTIFDIVYPPRGLPQHRHSP